MKAPRLGFPHWILSDEPTLQTCSGAIYRAATQLALAYWKSGCLPITTDETTLAALCRIPTPNIRLIKPEVLASFYSMQPDLDETHDALMATYKTRVRTTAQMRETQQQKKTGAVVARNATSAAKLSQPLPTRADNPHTIDEAAAHIAMTQAQTSGNAASRPVRGPFKPGVTTFTD